VNVLPADFHFLRPLWLAALALLPVMLVYLARRRGGASPWERVVAPELRRWVIDGPRDDRRGARWPYWLLGVGALLAIVALAGPAWRKLPQPVFRTQSALVVALDLSRSMDAQDLKPSRLARARLKLLDLLDRRSEGQTALIAYAAQPFVVSPLTTDAATIAALVESLATELMPAQGSRADRALALAADLVQQAGMTTGDVLLITDGASPRDAEAAAALRAQGIHVSVLGIGTAEGAPIPLAKGGLYTDDRGDIVVAKLDDAALGDVARSGGGRYSAIRVDEADLDTVMPQDHPARGSQSEEASLTADLWREEGPWLLLPLALIGALAFRRGWIGLVLLLVPLSAGAVDWDGLWRRDDQRGVAALEQGDAARAAQLFEDPEWKASALYRSGRYDESAKTLEGHDTQRAHYNRGNALARTGQFPQAIAEYEEALRLDPNDADARYNRDLLRKQMQQQSGQSGQNGQQQNAQEQQRGQQAQQDRQGSPGPRDGADAQPESEPSQEAQERGEEQQDARSQDGEQSSESDDTANPSADASPRDGQTADAQDRAATEHDAPDESGQADGERPMTRATEDATADEDETARATEQWLRRIPDDPGGLLRRKFLYQYRQQQTPPEEETQPW
jgi:Ca-activated chloride channel family protein